VEETIMKSLLAAFVASLATMPAQTQQKHPADPADATAVVPPVRYESAFAGFRASREEKPAAWKEVNEQVSGAGHAHAGHDPGKAAKAAPKKPENTPTAKPSGHPH